MSGAILYVSFGGPESREDVIPFLENVTRGRGVPRERLLEVAEHYYHFGGRSPINDQNRAIVSALKALLARDGPALQVYWGNRNWRPLLANTLREMKRDGIERAFVFLTSAFSSYSGCRQYQEDIAKAKIDAKFDELEVLKLRTYYNHPGFLEPFIENTQTALAGLPDARLIFTAHSIPRAMAETSDYENQLREAANIVAAACGKTQFDLVWQSRSGSPAVPWLEPDILDHLHTLHAGGTTAAVLVPIGFISDHLEVLYDLDVEARELADKLGMRLARARTPGDDPRFVAMIRELVLERVECWPRRFLGTRGATEDNCAETCCPAPLRVRV